MKFTFCLQINVKVFYKLILRYLVGMVKHVHIANQNSEFLKGQYLIKGLDGIP